MRRPERDLKRSLKNIKALGFKEKIPLKNVIF